VCALAQERGLAIALEPLNRFESDLVNTAEDVMRLVKEVSHPAAKVMLDGFHMAIEERNLEEAITRTGDKLIHVQVSENYRGTPGTGQTDWDSLKRGLKNIQYQGALSIESFTPEIKELAGAVCIWKNLAENQDDFAQEGLHFLKKHFKENHFQNIRSSESMPAGNNISSRTNNEAGEGNGLCRLFASGGNIQRPSSKS
jgi:D-psicose/D-tagatose/L-ribulose 3-epimerase